MEFNVGDRVKRIKNSGWGMFPGDVGTVITVNNVTMTIKRDIIRGELCDAYLYDKGDFEIIFYSQKEGGEFEVGGEVECLVSTFCFIDKGAKYRVIGIEDDYIRVTNKTERGNGRYSKKYFKPVGKSNQKGEIKMSIPKVITDSYKETKDAVLVDKYFGAETSGASKSFSVLFKAHKDEILTEAKKLQKEADDKNK